MPRRLPAGSPPALPTRAGPWQRPPSGLSHGGVFKQCLHLARQHVWRAVFLQQFGYNGPACKQVDHSHIGTRISLRAINAVRGLTRYVTAMGTPANASSSVEVPDLVKAAPAAANASCLSSTSVTTIGRTGQLCTACSTVAATTGDTGTTGTTSGMLVRSRASICRIRAAALVLPSGGCRA